MTRLHIDANIAQTSHTAGSPCGDVVVVERDERATLVVLADGLGHGARAHVAATLHASRFLELCRRGRTARVAFEALVETQERARRSDLPFAALTVARIRNDGETLLLGYEAPSPILLGPRAATLLEGRSIPVNGGGLLTEVHCVLQEGDSLLLTSDGITQAGMGCGWRTLPLGWTSEGVVRALDGWLGEGLPVGELASAVHREARRLWADAAGDDCTALTLSARRARQVTVMTGPPLRRDGDRAAVRRFMATPGFRVVCGASTAKVVARELARTLEVEQDTSSVIAPPRYYIEGVDLVTEGAVTLNQAFNVFDTDPSSLEPGTGVTALVDALTDADRVQFLVGRAPNAAEGELAFQQLGVLPRATIVPLLRDRLVAADKLVLVDWL